MYTTNRFGRLRPLLNSEYINKQRQQLPKVHLVNGAIYVVKTDYLQNTRQFLADNAVPYVMPKEHSVDVDYELDLHFIEYLIQRKAANE